ncbi:quinolinate synthase NadA [Pseudodesulfovibrio cashew]|uniref:Quinolinate synthase n=1 Tax=Pseudodesulfovibrio cashew TaxID=2678688 RepID=A0A6I6JU61_9BACT|nr:quinolinate synthase NadA [Pseudodesulfovibrio cashew]QGY41234.1 quinolinate synthase NadA [Pseudodesulfovibrio cashew]
MEKSIETIESIRKVMGEDLAILGHHYQSDAVIAHTDIRGDSLELSRKISPLKAKYIVFCGVYFMAESAAILQRPDQKVFIPDTGASCPMADMAEAGRVETVLNLLGKSGRKIIPLTYVNSSAAVKGVVGRFGGSVCTSANAKTMLDWARKQGDAVLFLPDKHLARNTANYLGIPEEKRLILHEAVIDGDPNLYVDPAEAEDKELIIWPGYCPIHEEFTLDAIDNIRRTEPDAKIVVHPECDPSVVQAADGNGSTTFLIKYAEEAPAGSTIYIGTEENLVSRLAERFKNEKVIKPLKVSLCEDMGKITLENLAALLANIENETPVSVSDDVKEPARLALERMLEACA